MLELQRHAAERRSALTTPEAAREMKPTSNCANQLCRKAAGACPDPERSEGEGWRGRRVRVIRRFRWLQSTLFLWPFENSFFWILEGGENVLSNLVNQFLTPKWVRHIVVDDPNVMEIERHVFFIGGYENNWFL